LLGRALGLASGALLALLFILVGGAMLVRVLGYAWVGAEELVSIAFIWLVFLGAALAYHRDEHLDVDLLYVRAARSWTASTMRAWDGVILILQHLFMAVVFFGLVMMAHRSWVNATGALTWFRYGWIYVGVAVAIALGFLVVAGRLIALSGDDEADRP
jgi:TRAP-type C4-dicarboxylate transport system permease small subunit